MVLAHEKIPDLDTKNIQIYLKIIRDAARLFDCNKKQWVIYDEETVFDFLEENVNIQGLIVLFHKKDKEAIEAYLE